MLEQIFNLPQFLGVLAFILGVLSFINVMIKN